MQKIMFILPCATVAAFLSLFYWASLQSKVIKYEGPCHPIGWETEYNGLQLKLDCEDNKISMSNGDEILKYLKNPNVLNHCRINGLGLISCEEKQK